MIDTMNRAELSVTMEALYDYLKRRLLGSIRRGVWSRIEWQDGMRIVILNGWMSYMIVKNQIEDPDDAFVAAFSFSDQAIDLADRLIVADDWDEVPDHSDHEIGSCDLCLELDA